MHARRAEQTYESSCLPMTQCSSMHCGSRQKECYFEPCLKQFGQMKLNFNILHSTHPSSVQSDNTDSDRSSSHRLKTEGRF